ALKALCYHYTAETDVTIGVPTANRQRVEVEAIVGCFINLLPLRTDLSGNPSVTELLARVRDTHLEAIEHQHLPFERMLEGAGDGHVPLRQLVRVLLAYQVAPAVASLGGLPLERLTVRRRATKYDLAFELMHENGRVRGAIEYRTDLFARETIVQVREDYERLLHRLTA